MKKIVIGKPMVIDVTIKNGKYWMGGSSKQLKNKESEGYTKWVCDISGDFINTQLYYIVEKKWGEILTDDRLDAAVVALIPYIMYRSSEDEPINLVLEAPISEKLYFQLTSELLPAMERECSWYNRFVITGEVKKNEYSGKAVLTGVSGGIDSFYTLIKSKREFPNAYKVTHGLFIGMTDRNNYNDVEYRNAKEICRKLGIEFVYVESNVCGEIYESRHDAVSSFAVPSVALVLGKLFSVYYHSSTYTYDEFRLNEEGISAADSLLCQLFSTETLTMYSCSGAVTRAEKTEYISDDAVAQKNLLVCGFTVNDNGRTKNCSVCSKCTITMIDLDMAGRLDDFSDVFDIKRYRKNPLYYWGYVFYKEKGGAYIASTLEMAKKKHYRIPFGSRIVGIGKIIKHGFKRTNPYQHTFRP